MRELGRMLDESESEVERALLHAGMSYRSSRDTWVKTSAALGLAGSTAVVAGTAGAASLPPLAKIFGATGVKVLLALSVVGVVSAVPVGYRALHHRSDAAETSGVRSAKGRPETGDRLPLVVATDVAGAQDLPANYESLPPPAAPSPQIPARASHVSTRSSSSAGSATARPRSVGATVSLTQELAALDAARSTLSRGNAQGALFLLDGYGRTCPHGKLELEAELLRIDALAKNGQGGAARRGAEAFLKRHPSSVLGARARTYLGD